MLDFVLDHMNDRQFMITAFAAVAAIATVLTLAMPLLATDTLARRIKQAEQKIAQAEAAAIKEIRSVATDIAVTAASQLLAEAAAATMFDDAAFQAHVCSLGAARLPSERE